MNKVSEQMVLCLFFGAMFGVIMSTIVFITCFVNPASDEYETKKKDGFLKVCNEMKIENCEWEYHKINVIADALYKYRHCK